MCKHQGRHVPKSVRGRKTAANPPTGSEPVRKDGFVQRVPAWGASRLVTAGAVPGPGTGTAIKDRGCEELNHERPNLNEGLPVRVLGDVAENAAWHGVSILDAGGGEKPWLMGKGELLCSAPRNRREDSSSLLCGNYAVAGARTYGQWPEDNTF